MAAILSQPQCVKECYVCLISVQHDTPYVAQTVWTSAYRTSSPNKYKWPSGDAVLYGLQDSTQERQRIIINAEFKLIDQNPTERIGLFCEKTGMYKTPGCDHQFD